MNCLDLGFFTAIQALQEKKCTKSVDDLVDAVDEAYYEQPEETVDDVFYSLMVSMRDVLKTNGDNTKTTDHINKDKLRREMKLPVSLDVDPAALIESARELINLPSVLDPVHPTEGPAIVTQSQLV